MVSVQIFGIAIMKYGDEITTKLEELAISKTKSQKEWEFFKGQVLHSFIIAEKIGNRNVNLEEHTKLEERLVRLGILERKLDKDNEQKQTFKESVKYDVSNKGSRDESKQKVALETSLQRNAEQMYINTGMVPIGYKKDEKGKIVRIEPKIFVDVRTNRLSASKDKLWASENDKRQKQQLSR